MVIFLFLIIGSLVSKNNWDAVTSFLRFITLLLTLMSVEVMCLWLRWMLPKHLIVLITSDCRNVIFAVHNIVTYFNERGSNVFMASLDASKAFDRVNHFRLYTVLMKKMYRLLF